MKRINGYLKNIFLERVIGSEAGKRIAPLWIKKTPPLYFKKGGWVGRNKGLKTIVGPSHPTNLKSFAL